MIAIERLADVFVDVADTLVADFDLIDFMHTLAGHAAEITDASAVGVMLSDQDGTLHYMGSSSESARLLDLFQLQNQEGPCLDCFRSGRPVEHTDLTRASDRWPAFAPRAIEAGIRSVHAIPLRLRDRVIGAMNLFGAEPVPLAPEQVRVVQALADLATIGIIQEQAMARAEVLNEQLQAALNSRIVIEQAKGAVAQTFGISVEEAFNLLRSEARSRRVLLTELAQTVLRTPEGARALRQPEA